MSKPPAAALYLRISFDKDGRAVGVARQREDCLAEAAKLGWDVTQVFEENDTSAFKRRRVTLPDGSHALRVVRPKWDAMLAELKGGSVGAVLAYDLDRIARDPRDLEDLIDIREALNVQIKSVTGSLRLDNDADVTMARVMVAIANKSSRDTSRRVARASRQRAEAGRIHGGRVAFGYEAVLNDDKRVIAWQHHPEHAQWVREAARRILAGESLYAITRDWQSQGRLTHNGSVWRPRGLKRIVTAAAVAGYREHAGELVAASEWTAILGEDDWRRLRGLLGDDMHQPRPFPRGTTARKYALSGLVRCGVCDSRLASMPATKGGPASFYCSTAATGGCGKIRIAMEPLERFVTAQVLDYIDTPEFRTARAAAPGPDVDAMRDLGAAVAEDERRLERLDDDRADGLLDDARYGKQVRRLTDRIAVNRAKLDELAAIAAQPAPPGASELAAQWQDRDSLWKRDMLGLFVENVVVAPFPAGMTTHLSRRRGEDDEALAARRGQHLAAVLAARVTVRWTR